MLSRRHVLQLLAGGAALAGVRPAAAGEGRIDRLIGGSRALPTIVGASTSSRAR